MDKTIKVIEECVTAYDALTKRVGKDSQIINSLCVTATHDNWLIKMDNIRRIIRPYVENVSKVDDLCE